MTQQLELNFSTDPAPLIGRCLPAAPQDAGQLALEGDPDQGAAEADERSLETSSRGRTLRGASYRRRPCSMSSIGSGATKI